jgi:hypothetical protein
VTSFACLGLFSPSSELGMENVKNLGHNSAPEHHLVRYPAAADVGGRNL